jgi:hypothetical protein
MPRLSASRVWALVTTVLAVGAPQLRAQTPPPPPPPEEVGGPTDNARPTPPPPTTTAPAGHYLLLPDISLNGIFRGHLSSDKRDQNREKLRLEEAELGIQSFVYPEIKLDTFIVFDGLGGVAVEEGYLTFQKLAVLKQTLSAVVGRRKVPFGRVNQLHPHSWLYDVQPYVLTNLVAPESLTGDGAYLSYLLPTGKIFTQLETGFFSLSVPPDALAANPEPTTQIVESPGAGFADKFVTARLLTAIEALGGSVELGGSYAGGRGQGYALDSERSVRPDVRLSGLDLTYRHAGAGSSRLLLRGEYVRHQQTDGDFHHTADGWYVLADQRLDAFTSVALRYDTSAFPYAPGHERGVSLIATHQLTEQTYTRLQLIHGSRPGASNVNEIHLGLVWGVGPHTHNLE